MVLLRRSALAAAAARIFVLSTGLIFLFSLISSPKALIFVRRIRGHVFLEETTVNSTLSLNALNFTKRLPLTRLYSMGALS